MIVHNEILQQIEETLNEKRFVTISAFAGAGKTTLAIKYGDRQTQAKKKIVRFINADSVDKVLEAYRQLAKEFTIYVIDEKEENIIRLVHERIANLNSAILFIFDNVEDHKDIEPYLNSIINILNDKAQVIITTKNNNLSNDIENIILVESFSKKEAILYLKKSLKNRLNKKDIDKLVEDFGSNDAASPYRLSKAVAYLKANKLLKVNDYIITLKIAKMII
ncbi:AAA family ATPase [Rickettsia honei]|uniref:AAA family ATPase n=1 Tax=Rickettsia honei TaxID=37816 RepID=UPI0002E63790|nr:AAA family ATPase [Rickettsia honei]